MTEQIIDLPIVRPDTGRRLERLSIPECLARLSRAGIGRIAFAYGPAPVVLPINFALDGVTVVLRTAHDTQLASLPDGEGVALEIDHVDLDDHTGWSILMRGRIDRITDPADLEHCHELPLGHYAPGDRQEWRRISPATISGRRIAPAGTAS